tara:strand:+ start:105 stop:365 length:261 start_codon:yes stop_codon:yes gene_type:complete
LEQIFGIEGFAEGVLRTQPARLEQRIAVASRPRHRDKEGVGKFIDYFADDLQTVFLGHKDIGDDQIKRLGAVALNPFAPVNGGGYS